MVRTYNTKIIFEKPEDKILLSQSLSLANNAFNLVSAERFKMKKCGGTRPIHERTYHKVRKQYPNIPSQYIIKVIRDVIAKYESIRKNYQQIVEPPTKKNLQLQLDKRLFTWKSDSTKRNPFNLRKRIPPNENLKLSNEKKETTPEIIFMV